MKNSPYISPFISWSLLMTALLSLMFGSFNVHAGGTMKLAFGLAKGSPYDRFAEVFASEVEQLTEGSVKVRNFCCLKMGGEQEMFKKLQLGTLDATIIAQNNAGPFYPKLDILSLPYIFSSPEHAIEIVDGEVGQAIWADMPEEAGVHLIKITSVAFRHLYNTKHEILGVEDFKTLKYRVPKNTVMVDTYKAFGSDPVPLAWSETLTAVQTGTVDGGDLTIDVIYSQKFHEVAKHIAMTGHFVLTPPFFVSDRFMKKLNQQEREAVYLAADRAAAVTREMMMKSESELINELRSKHRVKFTTPAKAPFMEAAKVVQANFAETRGKGYVDLVRKIQHIQTGSAAATSKSPSGLL